MDGLNKAFFYVCQAGISPLNTALLGGGKYLFVFKISGELKVSSRNLSKVLDGGRAAIFSLDREYSFEDTGNTAFFVAGGALTASLMEAYGIFAGNTVALPDSAEDFFAICKSKDEREQAYLLHCILRRIYLATQEHSQEKTDTAQLIKEFIKAHATERLTLDEVAEVFFLSKSQIFRIFKSRFGISPMRYYIEKKVEKARQMLIDTDLRISDIAEALAFSDAKHLSKAFFNIYGILPKNFRKEHKHNK